MKTLTFTYQGETKNNHRYDLKKAEGGAPSIVGTIYVPKVEGAEPAKELTVTVA